MSTARTSLAAGVGLAQTSPSGGIPIDRVEARLFSAEELFARIGSAFWVGLCRFERARALRIAGEGTAGTDSSKPPYNDL